MNPRDLERYLTNAERAELDALIAADIAARPWLPLPGPQRMAYESDADVIGYGGAAGGGKGLALGTPLPTPYGWTTMGEVQVGDMLFAPDGQPCRVTAASDINNRQCYRLTFDDGSSIVADDVHRWVTFDAAEMSSLTRKSPEWRAARRAKRPGRAGSNKSEAFAAAITARNKARAAAYQSAVPEGTMRDTSTLAATLRTPSGRSNHAIPVGGALQCEVAHLPIPPYTLGAWLGDGASRNGQLTGIDAGIWQRIEADGFEVRHYDWDDKQHSIIGLKVLLRDLGVLENKHIPAVYLRASFEQRLELLRGLMDTDGHAALDGGSEFDGVNEALVLGVLELVRSLGVKATLQVGTAKLKGRSIGPKWRVKFTTAMPVFGLQRKLERLPAKTRRTGRFRYVVACEPVDSVPTRCISVDSPTRQYLAGAAMVPTHNTDLLAGLALCEHSRSLIIRREKAQTEGVVQRLTEIVGGTAGYNSQKSIWRLPAGRRGIIEFGGLDNPGDERRWQGRPHDLKAFDEVTEQREDQVRFVMGWTRTSDPAQRTRVLMTFNPPTTAEGRWVIQFFAPWLDTQHALYPTPPGTLRWAAMIPGADGKTVDVWLDRADPFVFADGIPCYDFDRTQYTPEQIITPQSRTFIPARVTDNPYYMASGYIATLQSLPEPLRSQMLFGDFLAGIKDDPWQVIPTRWVEQAQARWQARARKGEQMSMGVDVARGGQDNTVIAARYARGEDGEYWFDELKLYSGAETPSGRTVAGLVVSEHRDHAPIHLDVIGVGASPYDVLCDAGQPIYGINVAERATRRDRSGRLDFFNLRAQLWWAMREALDPENGIGVCLPPDKDLLAELCAPRWQLRGTAIKVESRDDVVKRVGRSPDRATAVILALMDTPKVAQLRYLERNAQTSSAALDYDPYKHM